MDISKIIPYENNAKKHDKKQIAQIAASIKEFGFNQPIVIDNHGVIIVGHGRYEAAKLLGLQDVPTITAKLSEEKARAYRLADNKLNESDWDMSLVIEELKLLTPALVDLTGFERDLILETEEDEDSVPEPKEKTKTKIGDIFQLGEHRVMCGDSTKLEHVEQLMAGKRTDMCFTDPPWNVAIGLDSNPRHRQREGLINDNLGENFFDFLKIAAANIALFNDGDLYCVMGCEEWPNIHRALTDADLHWSSTIVWVKDIFVLGRSKYHRRYEPIWYGWKEKSTFCADRKQDDVWEFPRPKKSEEHPTMKPVELVQHAIVNSSPRGGAVLDLFLGSGTTLIAAEKTERICYGMELDPQYVDVIIERWEKFTGQKAKKI